MFERRTELKVIGVTVLVFDPPKEKLNESRSRRYPLAAVMVMERYWEELNESEVWSENT